MLRTSVMLGIAMAAALLVGPCGAYAFSQIEGENGGTESKEGIVAVPLPPLSVGRQEQGPQRPAPTSGQNRREPTRTPVTEGTDEGEVPISPEDEAREFEQQKPVQGPPMPANVKPLPASGSSRKQPRLPLANPENYQDEVAPRDVPTRDGRQMRLQIPSEMAFPVAATPNAGASAIDDPSGHGAGPVIVAPADDDAGPAEPLPAEISYGSDDLPKPVRDLRDRLIEIAESGEIERLRPYIAKGADGTVLSFGDDKVDDPIKFLKSASGDGGGVEILAILLEVLEAGHVRVEPGTGDEIYVWPYFTQVDIGKLTKPQLVQLFEIVTAGDYQAMKEFGAYNFYRIGISPDGKMQFFVAGD
ncbi:hypothetical protein [Aurantimonas sp. VKM B-3413]|uniref:hypothetical protein n=1 Tax=Aurantimonas sp. VKM B-3413 TaxID=2779401 RepID=UPI001E5CC1AA|nr:hypothetical protein [Aurantimonas sp. VKM B-3413]MCB8836033.1 hypothetical protein [Aurantimonas sp. VKM B-3413]